MEHYHLTDLSELVGPLAQYAVGLGYIVHYQQVEDEPVTYKVRIFQRVWGGGDVQVATVRIISIGDNGWEVHTNVIQNVYPVTVRLPTESVADLRSALRTRVDIVAEDSATLLR